MSLNEQKLKMFDEAFETLLRRTAEDLRKLVSQERPTMGIKEELERERYDASMRERTENGLPVISFAAWQRDQAVLSEMFDEIKVRWTVRLPVAVREGETG